MYVHWRLNQHRFGFPGAGITNGITVYNWWEELNSVGEFRLPKNTSEYCRLLDSRGPELIVFFRDSPLARCRLRQYDFYDVSAETDSVSDIRYYFIRKRG